MEQPPLLRSPAPRRKLGLALAGGGFRASLFHLGVLRRMAELDLLRRVELLSTVSGGSIVGALYLLRLKRALEGADGGRLSRDDYVAMVEVVERDLVAGIGKNLRTRLFTNPLRSLRVMLTGRGLGGEMARLYERHVFRRAVRELAEERAAAGEGASRSRPRRATRPGRLPLRELRIRPGCRAEEPTPSMARGIEAYNRRVIEALEAEREKNGAGADGSAPRPAVATRLVLNATSLNAGARFWFSSSEVGDWRLGQARRDEVDDLLARKALLERPAGELEAALEARPVGRESAGGETAGGEAGEEAAADRLPARTVALAAWWKAGDRRSPPPGGAWDPLFHPSIPLEALADAPLGLLRQAKLPAWYLEEGWTRDPPVTGGRSGAAHWALLWDALARIDGALADALRARMRQVPELSARLVAFVRELYLLRTAGVVHPRVGSFWGTGSPDGRRPDRTATVGDAVAASANFPPLFPPFRLPGLYDDLHVRRLGLTDGGVYDNLGVTALADEGCTEVVASDTGGLFERRPEVAAGRVGMMARVAAVLQHVVAGGTREAMAERRRVSRELAGDPDHEAFLQPRRLSGLAYFHIASDPRDPAELGPDRPASVAAGGEDPADRRAHRRALAGLRTDLDAFGEAEVAGLVNHGYATADGYLRTYFDPANADAPLRNDFWSEPPALPRRPPMEGRARRRILEAGGRRFFRALRVFAPLPWIALLAAAVAAVAAAWGLEVSAAGAAGRLTGMAADALVALAPWLETLGTLRVPAGPALIAILAAAGLLAGLAALDPVERLRDTRFRPLARTLAGAGRLGRSFAGGLVLLFGLLPVALALVGSALAWASELLFSRPWLRAARRPPGPVRRWLMERLGGGAG